MQRFLLILGFSLLALSPIGCAFTIVEAPGARGTVLDATTHAPIAGATVSRLWSRGQWDAPPTGIPGKSVLTDKQGNFHLAPVYHTHFPTCYLVGDRFCWGYIVIVAPGYNVKEIQGAGTPTNSWLLTTGQITLSKP